MPLPLANEISPLIGLSAAALAAKPAMAPAATTAPASPVAFTVTFMDSPYVVVSVGGETCHGRGGADESGIDLTRPRVSSAPASSARGTTSSFRGLSPSAGRSL